MEGFGLLAGHLLGDYIAQNDWMAANKTNAHPGPQPLYANYADLPPGQYYSDRNAWIDRMDGWIFGHLACTIHCLLYTLCVWACSCWWMPWWGLLVCFAAHWPIDRFQIAAWWMRHVSGQRVFLEKMGPWSVIIVDNTAHLLTLFVIGVLA